MRVTAEVKQRTQDRIVQAACDLFSDRGFEKTTTRDIAKSAGIATGTLFNYFPSKEALAVSIIANAVSSARDKFESKRRGGESLEELLFLLVVTELREMAPHRSFVRAVLETALSPFNSSPLANDGAQLRAAHLEAVADLVRESGLVGEPSLVVMHLYWTLYVGVVAFWSNDASPKQEETLVLLDQSLRLFVASLSSPMPREEARHGA